MLGKVSTGVIERLASALVAAAAAHEAKRYDHVDDGFDEIEAEVRDDSVPPGAPTRFALDFWDGWIDARNHDWLYYDGISKDDWPIHARVVAECVRTSRVPDDPALRNHFAPRPRTTLRTRFARFLRRPGSAE